MELTTSSHPQPTAPRFLRDVPNWVVMVLVMLVALVLLGPGMLAA